MKVPSLLVSSIILACAANAEAQETSKLPGGKVLVLVGQGSDPALATLGKGIVDAAAAALDKRDGFSSATPAALDACYGKAESAEDLDACVEKAGETAAARYVLSINLSKSDVTKLRSEYILAMTLIERGSKLAPRRDAESFVKEDEGAPLVDGLVARLLGEVESLVLETPLKPEKGRVLTIGVLDFQGSRIDEGTVKALGQLLCVELSKLDGVNIVSPEDIDTILTAEQLKEACGTGEDGKPTACLAQIAGAFNTDYIVSGRVSALSKVSDSTDADDEQVSDKQVLREYMVILKLLDSTGVQVKSRKVQRVFGPKEELKRAIRTAGRELVGAKTEGKGTVVLSGPVSGAEIYVADAEDPVGVVPTRLDGLQAGRLDLRLELDGYYTWKSDVFVQPGEENLVWAELDEAPRAAFYEKWWFWTIVVAGLAAGGTVLAVELSREPENGSGTVTIQ